MSQRVASLVVPPEVAVQTFGEVEHGYSRDEAVLEAQRAASDYDFTQARRACPFRVDVEALTRAIGIGDFDGALDVVLQYHPWPTILGAHCQKPCETPAVGPPHSEGLRFSGLERAAGDYGHRDRFAFRAGPSTGRQVAIVGAGSAASAAAYRLRQLGHAVAMYEQLPVPGGMMAVGYPDFRLPAGAVRRDNTPKDWGVETHYEVRVDRALLDRLRGDYDAVLIGTGKFQEVRLGVPGEQLEGVQGALSFLTDFKLGRKPQVGPQVVIAGGGQTAQDVARTCLRLGCEATVLYWRGPTDVRAGLQRRARRAVAEGASFTYQTTVIRALGEDGRVSAVECVRTEEAAPTAESSAGGGTIPTAIPGSNFILPCDTFIEAIGEAVDLSFLPPEARRTEDGHVWVDDKTWQTSVGGLFAAGEVTGIVSTTMRAFASGIRAADSIDAFLHASELG